MRAHFASCFSLVAFLGCAQSHGTSPGDMSASQHEATAGHEEQAAKAHAGQYDPKALATGRSCTAARASSEVSSVVCWTSDFNPTDKHEAEAAEHHDLAVRHRAAAKALRDAEATSCSGISERDREASPFYHREDIVSVSKFERPVMKGRVTMGQLGGARAVFRAVPGLTAEWLQRLVNCHLARAAALGYDIPEMSYCPLALRGVTATVASVGDGFAVEVLAEDTSTAKLIVSRMQLVAPSGGIE